MLLGACWQEKTLLGSVLVCESPLGQVVVEWGPLGVSAGGQKNLLGKSWWWKAHWGDSWWGGVGIFASIVVGWPFGATSGGTGPVLAISVAMGRFGASIVGAKGFGGNFN